MPNKLPAETREVRMLEPLELSAYSKTKLTPAVPSRSAPNSTVQLHVVVQMVQELRILAGQHRFQGWHSCELEGNPSGYGPVLPDVWECQIRSSIYYMHIPRPFFKS